MLRWYPSGLLQVVLELTLLPIAFFFVFALNAILDSETPWLIGTLSGPGISSDLWIILVLIAIGWTIIYLGWRGANKTFKLLLIFWHIGLMISSFILVRTSSNPVIRGESIGFSISIEFLGPIFTTVTLILALIWLADDLRNGTKNRTVSPFQHRNKIALCLAGIGLTISGFAFWLNIEELGQSSVFWEHSLCTKRFVLLTQAKNCTKY